MVVKSISEERKWNPINGDLEQYYKNQIYQSQDRQETEK